MTAYRSWVEVELKTLAQNIQQVKERIGPGVKILQVIKADGYGHGAIEVAKVALDNGASMVGVANADEGVQLRLGEIVAPILILSPSLTSEIDRIVKYDLTPSVSDVGFATLLSERAHQRGKKIAIHVEVDTGMGRTGLSWEETVEAVEAFHNLPGLVLEGIFSHFAAADQVDGEFCRLQLDRLAGVVGEVRRRGIEIPLVHMANSAGFLSFPESFFDMIRPGIISYGVYPSQRVPRISVSPVMSFKTRVVQLRRLPANHGISYGRTYITPAEATIAVLPIGYGDGYGFLLSNRGDVLIRGGRAPVVGRVTMDLTMVDVSHIAGVRVDDEVVIIGRQGDERITAEEVAQRAGTISYEVLCAIGRRAPRIYLHEEKIRTVRPALRRRDVLGEVISPAQLDEIIKSCLQLRLNEEIGTALYHGIFESIFGGRAGPLEYRADFRHRVTFSEFDDQGDFFRVWAQVEYTKVLRHPSLVVACARNSRKLAELFEDPRCEYRWLLEGEGPIGEDDFRVTRVMVDDVNVSSLEGMQTDRGYEVICHDEGLARKVNRPVGVLIETETKQPRSRREFPVYIIHPTKGLWVRFEHAGTGMRRVRPIAFFAGRQRYPTVTNVAGNYVEVKMPPEEWIFPNSGITFVWEGPQ